MDLSHLLLLLALFLPTPEGPRWVVVGPPALVTAAGPLIALRARQGFAVRVVLLRSRQVAARSLRERVHAMIRRAPGPGFLLLLGEPIGRSAGAPAIAVPGPATLGPGYEDLPARLLTDAPYVDTSGDGAPEWSVGRLPGRDAPEIGRLVAKVVEFERAALATRPYRRTLTLVANVGGRGRLVDGLVAQALDAHLRHVVHPVLSLESISGLVGRGDRVSDADFHDATMDLLDRPALATIYAGHGWTRALAPRGVHPVFDVEDVPALRRARSNVFLAFACNLADLSHPDSLGKELLRAPGGPAAVIAAAGPSIRFGDLVLASEILHQLRPTRTTVRLGDLLRRAQRRSVAPQNLADAVHRRLARTARSFHLDVRPAVVRYTADLYQLLGDPASPLRLPRRLELEVEPDADPPGALGLAISDPAGQPLPPLVLEVRTGAGDTLVSVMPGAAGASARWMIGIGELPRGPLRIRVFDAASDLGGALMVVPGPSAGRR